MPRLEVSLPPSGLDFARAQAAAQAEANRAADGEAMLLAWRDAERDLVSPDVPECTGDEPGWLAYARSRGADLHVDVNRGRFEFLFLSL